MCIRLEFQRITYFLPAAKFAGFTKNLIRYHEFYLDG